MGIEGPERAQDFDMRFGFERAQAFVIAIDIDALPILTRALAKTGGVEEGKEGDEKPFEGLGMIPQEIESAEGTGGFVAMDARGNVERCQRGGLAPHEPGAPQSLDGREVLDFPAGGLGGGGQIAGQGPGIGMVHEGVPSHK